MYKYINNTQLTKSKSDTFGVSW